MSKKNTEKSAKDLNDGKFHKSKGLKALIFFTLFFFILFVAAYVLKGLWVNFEHSLQFFMIKPYLDNLIATVSISFLQLISAFKIDTSSKNSLYNAIGAYASCGIAFIVLLIFIILVAKKKVKACWYVPLFILLGFLPLIMLAPSLFRFTVNYKGEYFEIPGLVLTLERLFGIKDYAYEIDGKIWQAIIVGTMCFSAILCPIFTIWKNGVLIKQRSAYQGPCLTSDAFLEEPVDEEEAIPTEEVAQNNSAEQKAEFLEEDTSFETVTEQNETLITNDNQFNDQPSFNDEQVNEDDTAVNTPSKNEETINSFEQQNASYNAPSFEDRELTIGDTHDEDVDISNIGSNANNFDYPRKDVVVGGDQLKPLDQSSAFDNAPIFPYARAESTSNFEEEENEIPQPSKELEPTKRKEIPTTSVPSVTKEDIKEWIKDAMSEYQGANIDPAIVAAGVSTFGGAASAGPNANLRKGSVRVSSDGPKTNVERIPFVNRLLDSEEDVLKLYNELKNEILSWGVKSRVSNAGDTFRLHTKTYIRLIVAGKGIKLYMALDPKDYANSTIPVLDAGAKNLYRDFPLVFKVKSDLSLKRAKLLIQDCMEKDGLEQGKVLNIDYITPLRNALNNQDIDDDLDYDDEN